MLVHILLAEVMWVADGYACTYSCVMGMLCAYSPVTVSLGVV